jgi:predicted Rossmann fold nucleotide-binding protein DprA/Smf involved in DNA uptake
VEDEGLARTSGAGGPGSASAMAGPSAALASLGRVERAVAELVAVRPSTADELAARTGLSGATVLGALTMLELRGFVSGAWGRYLAAGPLARRESGRDR